MNYKQKAEERIEEIESISKWDAYYNLDAFAAIALALLYIGDVLNKHLSVIAKNSKELKDIAKGVKK